MSVIKDEFISDKITRFDLLPLSFLKMSPYTGSKRCVRYRMEKIEDGQEEKTVLLRVSAWTSPLAYDKTPETDITVSDFSFDDGGIDKCLLFLNQYLTEAENTKPDQGERQ